MIFRSDYGEQLKSAPQFFNLVVDSLPFPFLVIDLDYRVVMANESAKQTHPMPTKAETPITCYRLTHQRTEPCEGEEHPCPLLQVKETGTPVEVEHLHYDRHNGERVVRVHGIPVFDDEGDVQYLIEVCLDITQQREAEDRLSRERQRLATTLNSIGDGVIATDTEGLVTLMNPVAEQLTGWSSDEVSDKQFEEVFHILNELDGQPCEDPVGRVLREGETVGLGNHTQLVARDGTKRSIADSAAPIRGVNGDLQGVVVVFRDVTDERLKEQQLRHLSYHDRLTGLHNRAFAERRMMSIDREENLPISVIMADINGLKFINDTLGHSRGDKVLKKAAETIKGNCRKEDLVARVGGDEFMVMLPDTSVDQAEAIRQRIQEAADEVEINELGFPLSVALGSSTKESPRQDLQETIKKAESRMYRKKLSSSRSVRGGILSALMRTLEAKSHETQEHVQRMEETALKIADAIGLDSARRDELKLIIALHDIGKINIPEDILVKPSELTEEEWKIIRTHPEIGYRIASRTDDFAHVAEGILHHHEWWDGSGYPDGLKGEEIPLVSRITAVADAYDAMISQRPYSQPMSESEAVAELRRCAGTQFDPGLVEVFLEIINKEQLACRP